MNKWQQIANFWEGSRDAIVAADSNEWAVPTSAFAWIALTPIEQWLWEDMRNANMVMYPQWPIGEFFVDFANPMAMVVIECDGKAFHRDHKKDARRDAWLTERGWTIYRFSGHVCNLDYDEETEMQSEPQILLAEICERHQIKRVSRTTYGWINLAGVSA